MKLNYVLVCDSAFASPEKKIFANGIFDTIQCDAEPTEATPVTHPSMTLVASFSEASVFTTDTVVIRIESPDGSLILPDSSVQITGSTAGKAMFIGALNMLSFKMLGDYTIHILSNEIELGRAVLTLQIK